MLGFVFANNQVGYTLTYLNKTTPNNMGNFPLLPLKSPEGRLWRPNKAQKPGSGHKLERESERREKEGGIPIPRSYTNKGAEQRRKGQRQIEMITWMENGPTLYNLSIFYFYFFKILLLDLGMGPITIPLPGHHCLYGLNDKKSTSRGVWTKGPVQPQYKGYPSLITLPFPLFQFFSNYGKKIKKNYPHYNKNSHSYCLKFSGVIVFWLVKHVSRIGL